MSPDEITDRALAVRRQSKLDWYVSQIEKAGKALAAVFRELRDDRDKPYLIAHDSWEHYCQDRWNMTPRRAQQLMAGESVRMQLADSPETASIAPTLNECQLREIATVPEPQRAQVLQVAQESASKLTAATIKRAKAIVIDGETGEPVARVKCANCGGSGYCS